MLINELIGTYFAKVYRANTGMPLLDSSLVIMIHIIVTVLDKIIAVEIKVITYQDEIKLEIGTYI